MLNEVHQREIVLAFNAGFLSKVYFEKCNAGSSDISIELEKIEETCWNGLLKEVLPEIFTMDIYARPLYIWTIRQYNSIMEIEMGEYLVGKDFYFCIDPYKLISVREKELYN
jgi:hypothetical protein